MTYNQLIEDIHLLEENGNFLTEQEFRTEVNKLKEKCKNYISQESLREVKLSHAIAGGALGAYLIHNIIQHHKKRTDIRDEKRIVRAELKLKMEKRIQRAEKDPDCNAEKIGLIRKLYKQERNKEYAKIEQKYRKIKY